MLSIIFIYFYFLLEFRRFGDFIYKKHNKAINFSHFRFFTPNNASFLKNLQILNTFYSVLAFFYISSILKNEVSIKKSYI